MKRAKNLLNKIHVTFLHWQETKQGLYLSPCRRLVGVSHEVQRLFKFLNVLIFSFNVKRGIPYFLVKTS